MTVVIISVLLLSIGGFIVFAIVIQLKEQARLEKARKIAALNNHVRQVRRYLDDIPPQYQPKDMRLWLFSRLVSYYDDLLAVQPDATITRRRKFLVEEMSECQTSKLKRRAKPINDELLILGLKRLFESFHLFLKQSEKDKTLNHDMSARYLGLIQFYKYKVNADFHAYIGRQSFLSGNYDKAIENYKAAISQLSPIRETAEAKTTIKQYNSLIAEIKDTLSMKQTDAADGSTEDKKTKPTEDGLNREWDNFIDDTGFKKKKHF